MQTPKLEEIQNIIVRGYTFLFARYVFLRFATPEQARQWLAEVAEWTTMGGHWGETKPDHCQNIAFTCDGLSALGLNDDVLNTFPKEFRDGMHTRCKILGDIGASRPELWVLGNPEKPATQFHALLMMFAPDKKKMDAFEEQHAAVRQRVGGVEVVHEVDAMRRLDKKEHFGYLDGASQPLIEGIHADAKITDANKNSPVRPIKTGEFILGFQNEYGIIPPSPSVPADDRAKQNLPPARNQDGRCDLGANGSFAVCRKLQQNVAAFRKFLKDNSTPFQAEAAKLENMTEEEWLAAKLVGRWRSGTPLMLYPDKDAPIPDKRENNDFTFSSDPQGIKTPIGSHIRRSNPRDTFGLEEAFGADSFIAVNRHRIIRRGVPYGPFADDEADDSKERGLVFICFNADIAVQYEFVQKWMNDPNFNGMYDEQDVFAHNHNTESYVDIKYGDRPIRKRIYLDQNFVTVKGGEYLFVPGKAALRYLAGL
jgi:Dyp-type peroxidase family